MRAAPRALTGTIRLTGLLAGLSFAACGPARPPVVLEPAPYLDPFLPRGFPPPLGQAREPTATELARRELGRHLFYDTRLSGNGTFACASCHRQELAFTDGRARAVGSTGQQHPRSAMSLANAVYNASLTWADPEIDSLAEQALVPLLNRRPVEMGMAGREEEILDRFRRDPASAERFREAFPGEEEPVSLETVTAALAAFQSTLLSGNSPFDRLLSHDEQDALSPSARRGLELFFSERLACSRCHQGFNLSGAVVHEGAPRPKPDFHNTGLYDYREGSLPTDTGLALATGDPADAGFFRAPTLRNAAVTAPYMHDGSIATLEDVIDHYAAGGRARTPETSEFLRGFELSDREKRDLVAFLQSLTDEGFLSDPRFGNPRREASPAR